MAAARYWRINGIATRSGGDLELSALQLNTAAGRVDQLATLTASHVPTSGSLTALADGEPATLCRFAADDVRSAGFWLQWDFGATAPDVTSVTLGAGASEATWAESIDVSRSADGMSWALAASLHGILFQSSTTLRLSANTGADMKWAEFGPSASTLNDAQTLYTSSAYSGSSARANASVSSGKHYWELLLQKINTSASASGNALNFGAWPLSRPISTYIYNTSGVYRAWQKSAQGDVFGFEFDADEGTLRVYRQGALVDTLDGLPVSAAEPWAPVIGDDNAGGAEVLANFKGPFVFTPSAGYAPLDSGVAGIGPRIVGSIHSAAKVAASAPVPAHSTSSPARLQMARDVEFGGAGRIYGTTKTKGTPNTPTKARVVLQHQRSKLPVRETWSDPVTGNFVFTGIDTAQQFLTLAEDAAGNFRPVAASRLTPEVLL